MDACVRVRSDLEAAVRTEPDSHKRAWKFLWCLVMNIFLIVWALITVTNNAEGVGSDYIPLGDPPSHMLPRFDVKWALWRALGGGLSGAAGTSILCIC